MHTEWAPKGALRGSCLSPLGRTSSLLLRFTSTSDRARLGIQFFQNTSFTSLPPVQEVSYINYSKSPMTASGNAFSGAYKSLFTRASFFTNPPQP